MRTRHRRFGARDLPSGPTLLRRKIKQCLAGHNVTSFIIISLSIPFPQPCRTIHRWKKEWRAQLTHVHGLE